MRFRQSVIAGLTCLTMVGCSASSSEASGSVTKTPAIAAAEVKWPELPGASSVQGLLVDKGKAAGSANTSVISVKNPPTLAEAVKPWVDRQSQAFAAAVKKTPNSGQQSLAMESSVCGASGTVLCFLVNSTSAVGSQSRETSQSWFVDSSDNSVTRGEELFTKEGAARVHSLVSSTVRKAEGGSPSSQASATKRNSAKAATGTQRESSGKDSPSGGAQGKKTKNAKSAKPTVPDNDYLHGAYFDTDGSLILLVTDPYSSGNASLSAYRVKGKKLDGFLTDRARKLRSTIMAGTAPSPLPTPSPSVQANPSGSGVDCSKASCVALTFDDGPGPQTPQLLDTLKAKGVRAPFFTIGPPVRSYPHVVARAVQEGHVVGNHTWNHPVLSKLAPQQVANELTSTNNEIVAAGAPSPILVRPPYGAKNPSVMSVIGQHGMVAVIWDVDTEDWKNRNSSISTQRALAGVKRGSIILMHDIHPSTIAAAGGLIDQLKARGYTLVTVPELLGNNPSGYVGREVYTQTTIR